MRQHKIVTKLENDGNSILCFATAVALFVVGMVGHIANYISPGSTNLDALLIVGLFYLGLAIVDLRVTARLRARASEECDEGLERSEYNRAA